MEDLFFYYAEVDLNGVLCVDRLNPRDGPWTDERVAKMAERYPEMIYFQITRHKRC